MTQSCSHQPLARPPSTRLVLSKWQHIMTHDPRDELWNSVFETYYDSYFQEIVADNLINRWLKFDDITKVLVAVTASGSAVAGWAAWNRPEYQGVWGAIAGLAALISIVHAALGVPNRLKDHGETKRLFSALRIDLTTFRHRMRIDPKFSLDEFSAEYFEFRQRFKDAIHSIIPDVARTKRVLSNSQVELDQLIGDTAPSS